MAPKTTPNINPPASARMRSGTPLSLAQFSIIVSILRSQPKHNVPRPICYRKGASRHPPASAAVRSATHMLLAQLAIIVSILRSQPLHNVPRPICIGKALPVIRQPPLGCARPPPFARAVFYNCKYPAGPTFTQRPAPDMLSERRFPSSADPPSGQTC